jgi:hypothetical protein
MVGSGLCWGALSFCSSMIFFGKPVPTFPDHALARGTVSAGEPIIKAMSGKIGAGVCDRSRLDRDWRESRRPISQLKPLGFSRSPVLKGAPALRPAKSFRLSSARPVSAGGGIPPQRRDLARSGRFCDARHPRLFQFPVDPQGGPVSPADHGQPSQGSRKCDQRRHRSILVVHSSSPRATLSRKPGRPATALYGAKWRGRPSLRTRIWPKLPGSPVLRSARPAGPRYRPTGPAPRRLRICGPEDPTASRPPARPPAS